MLPPQTYSFTDINTARVAVETLLEFLECRESQLYASGLGSQPLTDLTTVIRVALRSYLAQPEAHARDLSYVTELVSKLYK